MTDTLKYRILDCAEDLQCDVSIRTSYIQRVLEEAEETDEEAIVDLVYMNLRGQITDDEFVDRALALIPEEVFEDMPIL